MNKAEWHVMVQIAGQEFRGTDTNSYPSRVKARYVAHELQRLIRVRKARNKNSSRITHVLVYQGGGKVADTILVV